MKLQFKHQKFQADAARAVCDVFRGQPHLTPTYMIDKGYYTGRDLSLTEELDFTGWNNHPLLPQMTDARILENLHTVQRAGNLRLSDKLEGHYNLTVEMETGVGKTYTYIKTMYELNKQYGWSKFIIVVPSVAIREGVYKSFQVTQEHFAEEYGKKIRFFIYNSSRLEEIDRFASDSAINAMIINTQAFNARGKDARRIYMKLDGFRSRRPIDILAKTNPILIIDEPQSAEGKITREKMKEFTPLFTLRYSATHRPDSVYNMVYRLDAMEAYNKKLVKKIEVKGFHASGRTATESYVYLEGINLSQENPTATIEFDVKGKNGIRTSRRIVEEGFNLYENSGELDEYQNGYTITRIDGRDNSIEFKNGTKLFAGDIIGAENEKHLRRLQIRETILSHIEREQKNFRRGIKVLSLFFIDEVAKYRQYDSSGQATNGVYADIFEEEYTRIIEDLRSELSADSEYLRAITRFSAHEVHAGYFSIDKNKKTGQERFINSKTERGTTESSDADAYDLIMKDKERLLDRNEPVRFIFSHSALREGWDNPNVFQICTLKQSTSDIRKRQEVGRGLRLCVNQNGERMDAALLGEDVHSVNLLTIIASESYDQFAKGLQEELAAVVTDRPRKITAELFIGKGIRDAAGGNEQIIDEDLAQHIYESLIKNDYVVGGQLTERYYQDKANAVVKLPEAVREYRGDLLAVLDTVYDPQIMRPADARSQNVAISVDTNKLHSETFKKLWAKINAKSAYVVDFDTDELVQNAITALDRSLIVQKLFYTIETGVLETISSRESLVAGEAFTRKPDEGHHEQITATDGVKYDLLGRIVEETGLTRAIVAQILQGIEADTFAKFRENPEDFILKASRIINDQKASIIIEHITYNKLETVYETDIFAEGKGQLNINTMRANRHLYDHVRYDSEGEKEFAQKLDTEPEVVMYVKLPKGFYISTPVGKYNPDWAIAFNEEKVKHIYFVAETKGSLDSLQLRAIEDAKIHCARKHFKAISTDKVVYDVVDNYQTLLNKVLR